MDSRGADAPHIRVSGVDDDISRSGDKGAGDDQQRSSCRSEPVIADLSRLLDTGSPSDAQCRDFRSLACGGVRQFDFEVPQRDRKIFEIDLSMSHHFEESRGWVRSAVNDAPASRMPTARSAKTATAVERSMVAESPDCHAAMPSSI